MGCGAALDYYEGSTGILEVALEDEEGAPINDATVNITLYHGDETEVAGAVWPQPMNYVASSDGVYTLTITADLDVEINEILKLVGIAVNALSQQRKFNRDIVVVEG